ncbi:MAG: baseplate J/gp47 family protein [Halopseudomonas aestusnigri]
MANNAYPVPTINEIDARIQGDINYHLKDGDSRMRRSVIGVLGKTVAGESFELHNFIEYISLQLPDTADTEQLEGWARVWGVTRKGATKAQGQAVFDCTIGATVLKDTKIQRLDGVTYLVVSSVVATGITVTVDLEAETAGEAGNAQLDTVLSFVTPTLGVQAEGKVATGGVGNGADIELDGEPGTNEHFRGRLKARIQTPPHGGAGFDYKTWALSIPGVSRVWVYAQELGLGTVTVRFMMDDTYIDGIPQPSDVQTVQNFIEANRPVTSDVSVVAPIKELVDVTVQNLSPDTPETRLAVIAELNDLIIRVGEPGGKIAISKFWESISIASGEDEHEITLPAATVQMTTGKIPALGTVSFVTV